MSDTDTVLGYYDTATHLVVPRAYPAGVDSEDLRDPPRAFSDMGSKVTSFLDSDQEAAWNALSSAPSGGVLSIPGGRGKTVLAAMLIAQRQLEAIVILPTLSIIEGWRSEIMAKIGVSTPDIGVYAGGSNESELDKPIVLASLDSLINKAPAITFKSRSRRGTVIFDEAHHLGTRTHILAASLFHGERYALSATPGRPDGRMPLYTYHCGPTIYWSQKHSMTPKVVFKRVDTAIDVHDRRVLDVWHNFSFPKYWGVLGKEPSFNQLIVSDIQDALRAGRTPMVFTHSVDHAKSLQAIFSSLGYPTGLIYKDVKWKDRRSELLDNRVVIGTMGAAHEGLNKLDLDFVLISMPVGRRGEARFLQTVWRSLRHKSVTPVVLVYIPKIDPCLAMERMMREYASQQRWPVEGTDSSMGELSKVSLMHRADQDGSGGGVPESPGRFRWRGPRGA